MFNAKEDAVVIIEHGTSAALAVCLAFLKLKAWWKEITVIAYAVTIVISIAVVLVAKVKNVYASVSSLMMDLVTWRHKWKGLWTGF
jgi:dTDP-4-amino-4,6-dideoxygalactose transaminase